MGTLSISTDLWVAQRGDGERLRTRARSRLQNLVTGARTGSVFFRDLYVDLPVSGWDLADLPTVSKPELMEHFDDWVTDRRITRRLVEEYVAAPSRVGVPFMNGVFVCTSSGTTGRPGLFVHDASAVDVYWALPLVRGFGMWFGPRDWARFLARGRREAQIIGVGAHFAGAAWAQRSALTRAGARRSLAVVGVHMPIDRMRMAVQDFDPAVIAGYPSAIEVLGEEQLAGRMHVDPILVATSGEDLHPTARAHIQAAFGCPVRDTYGTSETVFMAFGCSEGWLHLSNDWFLLEPVDSDGAPTPPGRYSHSALVTNLANQLQPIIRYDIGDSILMKPERCACGSPLPAFRIAGRCADVLLMRDGEGRQVTVVPLLIGTAIDATPGTNRTQVLQVSPTALRVRGDIAQGHAPSTVWDRLTAALRAVLDGLGLANVTIEITPDEGEYETPTGKFRRVVPLPP